MASKPRGLGRGLGALMGDAALQEEQSSTSLRLPIAQVEPRSDQPRKVFDEDSLHDLADSIREHGILQPLTVRRLASGYYQIVAGERRWRAARLAGLSEVPVVIIEADDKKTTELALIENLQRENLSPLEEAEGYHTLMEEYGMTQEEVAARMGKSRPAIANALRLLTLPASVLRLINDGALSAGHARAVLSVKGGENVQRQFAEFIVKQALSVRQAEEKAKTFVPMPDEKPEKPADPNAIYLREAEKSLSGRLGRKVTITSGKKKGRLELEFYSVDDLNALLDLLETLPGSGKKEVGQ